MESACVVSVCVSFLQVSQLVPTVQMSTGELKTPNLCFTKGKGRCKKYMANGKSYIIMWKLNNLLELYMRVAHTELQLMTCFRGLLQNMMHYISQLRVLETSDMKHGKIIHSVLNSG